MDIYNHYKMTSIWTSIRMATSHWRFAPLWAMVIIPFNGCGDSGSKPSTEEEARAREVSERDDRLQGLRFGAYQKVRNGLFSNGADPVFQIAGNDLRFLLGLMYAGAGHRRLALYEASGFDMSAAENERAKAGYHFLRGYVYSSYGWTRLAREEFEIVATFETGNPDHADLVRALVHFGMVYLAISEGDFERAALEVRRMPDLFEGDAIGEVCIALATAKEGDFRAAADHLDKVVERGVLAEEWNEKLRKLSTDLKEAGSPMQVVAEYISRAAAERVLGPGSEIREKFKEILGPIRERANKIMSLVGADASVGGDGRDESTAAETAPASSTGDPVPR